MAEVHPQCPEVPPRWKKGEKHERGRCHKPVAHQALGLVVHNP